MCLPNTHSQVAVLLALGLDPDKVVLYKHTALAWLLSTAATSGTRAALRTVIEKLSFLWSDELNYKVIPNECSSYLM